mgnify:CR=1 FL=1
MELTDRQKLVLYKIKKGVEGGVLQQTLGGYAGTGKTTLVRYITKFFPNFAVCAYTGKAANVLRKKEIQASTIHSLIYKPEYDYGVLVGFNLVDPQNFEYEGIIVDEASMVSSEIYSDLMSYELPTIYVGDHGQLKPIGTDFNLMEKPDYTLEEIHRNAGNIARFAERIRHGYKSTSFPETEEVSFRNHRKLTTDDLLSVDQVICAYNKTRVEMNARIREGLGFKGLLNVGERVMCLKNNKSLGLFNGMQGIVRDLTEDTSGRKLMDLEFDNILYPKIWYDTKQFGKERPEFTYVGKVYPVPFDYAYCSTAHKAQGDEWEKVCVIEQRCAKWDHLRWAYTAASRAKTKLLWAW